MFVVPIFLSFINCSMHSMNTEVSIFMHCLSFLHKIYLPRYLKFATPFLYLATL